MFRSAVRSLIVLISCASIAPFAASASSLFFDFDRIDDFVFPTDAFAVFIEIEIDEPGVTGVEVTMGTVVVPLELSFDGTWEEATDTVFPSLAALRNAVSGSWTIVVTGGADASSSSFTVDANGLLDADFPPTATSLSPAHGATGVSANTLLSWTAIPDQFVVGVFAENDLVNQETDSLSGGLPIGASSWQPPLALPNGSIEWGVFYARNPELTVDLVGDITVTAGTINWLPHELIAATGINWPTTKPLMALASESIVAITVPEPDALLQGGVTIAMVGVLASLRSRKRV